MKKWSLISVGGISLLVLIGIGVVTVMQMTEEKTSGIKMLNDGPSLVDAKKLSSLDQLSTSSIDTSRLADSLVPPTNKWFSGMVLAAEPQPGFNVPNSILPSSDGFELGLPKITSSSEGIYGPHTNGIQLKVNDAAFYKLTRYDELTLTLSYYNDSNQSLIDVVFAAGSPYAFVSAKRDVGISLRSGAPNVESDGLTTFQNNDAWYGVKASNGKTGQAMTLKSGEEVALFSANQQSDISKLAKQSAQQIESAEVSYEVTDSRVKTILSYKTQDNKPTVLVKKPHQKVGQDKDSDIVYRSMYGDIGAYESNTIKYSQPIKPLEWSLPLGGVSGKNKDELRTQLKIDIDNSKLDKKDTYFGGKQLQRMAHLVMVADAIGDKEQRDIALTKLKPALAAWFDDENDRSFYYDKAAKTIVGREASFGSDKELNDHHFHYGYFIYAASVVAKFDNDFLNKYTDDVNMLVADIANYNADEPLPLRRNFDAYAGHSWASGFANYKDGNNQESSSEAVNAWTATGLWAEVTSNNSLMDESAWLLANEASSANKYWLSVPPKEEYLKDFASPLVSINWGGKREYKTFFSDEPNAKLAIQLLPLNSTMQAYVSSIPTSVFEGGSVSKPYGDYILMAGSSQDGYTKAKDYPESMIDDGNSRSYMMAYALAN